MLPPGPAPAGNYVCSPAPGGISCCTLVALLMQRGDTRLFATRRLRAQYEGLLLPSCAGAELSLWSFLVGCCLCWWHPGMRGDVTVVTVLLKVCLCPPPVVPTAKALCF